MKRIYTLLATMLIFAGGIYAQSCTPDNADTTIGYSPKPDSLPCIVSGEAYNQTIQAKIQSTYDSSITVPVIGAVPLTITIDSVQLDSVTGLPSGILWYKNPSVLYGGHVGCVNLYGTTTAAAGQYPINGYGTVWMHVMGSAFGQTIDTPYVYNGNLNTFPGFGSYYVTVCHGSSGINTLSTDLNSALSIYPNPNSGVFELKLDAAARVNGEILIYDLTGNQVYAQPLNAIGFYNTSIDLSKFAKGLYTLQLRSENGFAVKRISIE